MATKINPAFYGAENTFVDIQGGDTKHSTYSLSALFTNNIYTGGQFDTTAAPWGCGKSSFSSDYTFFAGKGQNWTVLDMYNSKKNTPMFMYWASEPPISGDVPSLTGSLWSVASYTRGLYKARMSPNAKFSSGSFRSTLSIDDNQSISIGSTDVPFYPITYLDYQKIRAVITDVWYKPEGATNNQKTTMSAIKNGTVSVDTIVAFKVLIYHKDSPSNAYPLYIGIGGAELDMPELYRTCYYGEDVEKWVRTWRYVQTFGYWELGSSSYGYQYTSTDSFNTTSWFDGRDASDKVNRNSATSAWGHIMPDTQTFDDVTYTWHTGLYVVDTNDPQNLSNKIANGDLYASGTVGSYAYMTFDDYVGNKNIAAFNAILHEVAYIGLPFTYSTDYVGQPIGGNDIYLPIFDHMVTTGRFESGTRSLTLENATWGDVFGVDMPDYDPDYDPDAPPDPDEGDTGNLNNKGLYTNRFSNQAYNIWALYGTTLSNNGLDAIISAINDLYITDPDGNSKWQLDFKGTNPTDYIVGLYAYPLNFAVSDNSYPFVLGPVEFDTINVKKYADNGYFSFGVIDLSYDSNDVKWYGDFRDYPPYSCAELYIPFCGTYDIDLAFFIGHTMEIIGYYDIYTGALSCAIYRDSKTLYKTVNGQIGVQLPLTSTRAGDYQNNIHSIEVALKQNDIRLATSAITLGASAATAIATGGASLAAGAGAIGGLSTLANALTERDNIEYKISHTQPVPAQTGAAETQNGYKVGGIYPKLYIKRAKKLSNYDPIIYSHTIGNACCINDIIGNMTGLAVCSKVDTTGITATADEIQAIKQAFAKGVIV